MVGASRSKIHFSSALHSILSVDMQREKAKPARRVIHLTPHISSQSLEPVDQMRWDGHWMVVLGETRSDSPKAVRSLSACRVVFLVVQSSHMRCVPKRTRLVTMAYVVAPSPAPSLRHRTIARVPVASSGQCGLHQQYQSPRRRCGRLGHLSAALHSSISLLLSTYQTKRSLAATCRTH